MRDTAEQIYFRQLPGGGFVAIEVTPTRTIIGRPAYRGELVVERRADHERRVGHDAPVIAEKNASTLSSVFHELFPIAQSNVLVATRCLERERHVAR